MVTVKLENNDVIIKFPNEYISNSLIEKFLERLNLEELAEKNQMTENQVEEISEEINNDWWKKNNDLFLSGIKK